MQTTLGRVHSDRRPPGGRREQTWRWLHSVGCLVTLACSLFAAPCTSDAQPAAKVHRIGLLSVGSPLARRPNVEAFQQGLRDLGYVEGQNMVIEYRYAEGKVERLPELVAELVQLQVAVILAMSIPDAVAAKRVTTTIPIVLGAGADPVAIGLVASLARPGGNVTGLSDAGVDVMAQRVALLAELLPTLSRVAVLWDPTNPVDAFRLREAQAAAEQGGRTVQAVAVSGPADVERAFAEMVREGTQAFVAVGGPVFFAHRTQLAALALRFQMAGMFSAEAYAEAGGLMSYGTLLPAMYRRAATYVHKILHGATPTDLPVERAMDFELVINLKTAQALGITMPPSLLFQANKVIK